MHIPHQEPYDVYAHVAASAARTRRDSKEMTSERSETEQDLTAETKQLHAVGLCSVSCLDFTDGPQCIFSTSDMLNEHETNQHSGLI